MPAPSALVSALPGQKKIYDAGLTRQKVMMALGSEDKDTVLSTLMTVEGSGTEMVQFLNVDDRIGDLMSHQDPDIAAQAVLTMACYGKKAVQYAEWIAPMSGHPSPTVRAAVCEALGKLSGELAEADPTRGFIDAIVPGLGAEPKVKVAAIKALALVGGADMFETIIKFMDDQSTLAVAACIEACGTLASESQEVLSLWDQGAMAAHYTKCLSGSGTKNSALASVETMGPRAPQAAVGPLVACLGDTDSTTRAAAVAAVGAVGAKVFDSKEGLGKLLELLKSDSPGPRAAAAQALALGGKAEHAEAVAALLKDDEEDETYLQMQVGLVGRRLPSALRRPKCAALSALGRLGDESYAAKVSEALGDSNWEVRLAAAEALGLMGSKAKKEASALTGVLEDDAYPVRAMACNALGAMKDESAVPRLIECFEDSSYSVRAAAVTSLGEIGQGAEEYTHDVFKLLNDSVGFVKGAAAKTLSKLGDQGANYAGVVATLLYDDDPELRVAVLQALGGMGSSGAMLADEISDMVDDPVPAVKQAAVAALEAMGYMMPPMLKDWGAGLGVPVPAVTNASSAEIQGVGLYYKGIKESKGELMASGQWIEGIL
jgi:HEAT repeat protein